MPARRQQRRGGYYRGDSAPSYLNYDGSLKRRTRPSRRPKIDPIAKARWELRRKALAKRHQEPIDPLAVRERLINMGYAERSQDGRLAFRLRDAITDETITQREADALLRYWQAQQKP